MKKHLLALALIAAVTAPTQAIASEPKPVKLVPLRALANQLGADLQWESATATATLIEGSKALQVQIGSRQARVGDSTVELSAPLALREDRTYIPLQLVEKLLGHTLNWNESEGRLSIGNPDTFTAQGAKNGDKASYDLNLTMNEAHEFNVTAKVQVENVSDQAWDNAVFYFIPNVFTDEFKNTNVVPHTDNNQYARVKIDSLKANGSQAQYQLSKDTLDVQLPTTLKPGEKTEIEVTYSFTLPQPGNRFAKDDAEQLYKLAEWYPMLATYNESGWNKFPYYPFSESYFTDFSDFKLSYDLPKGYSFISSSEADLPLGTNKGELTMNNVKEIYAQIDGSPNLKMLNATVDGVDVRVFGRVGQEEALQEIFDAAKKSVHFYDENIGHYPHKQLDIMTNDGGMEYPGIVTVPATKNPNDPLFFKETVAHEIAHQWFNFTVSSDSFHEGWLDEGMTELATSLYMYGVENSPEQEAFRQLRYKRKWKPSLNSHTSLAELNRADMLQAYYTQPAYRMWDLFKRNSGTTDPLQTSLHFMHDYFNAYQNKQITTPEFLRFTESYFPTDANFYASWVK
ncbi:M1 family peptidase [Tumebacillus sp. ITR2]|uniref:M1 family peptidase n=1 Tax=Tumebacillus amylolyticus TaxID=2801339 RepID=A0ABS1J995_9BACL|nr:stalk domain-containing protein [Tumebacillus amylolyticus]MBL0386844.1 M1 family peptidase [Tumebacillus amylolyticus]